MLTPKPVNGVFFAGNNQWQQQSSRILFCKAGSADYHKQGRELIAYIRDSVHPDFLKGMAEELELTLEELP